MTVHAPENDALLRDIELSRRFQVFGAWCGPAFAVLLFGGWGVLGGFIPLIPPLDDAGQVAAAYSSDPVVARIGLSLAMIGTVLTLPFFLTLSMQMRRTEPRVPFLSIMQLISGVVVTVVLLLPILFFVVGVFRPDRPVELTKLMDDLSYVCLILPWPPIFGQLIPLVVVIFNDRRPEPVFPRWLGYANLWVAALLLPANLLIFFKSGPFAWNGILGFWVPAAVFGLWYLVMCWALLRAVRSEAAEDRALALAA